MESKLVTDKGGGLLLATVTVKVIIALIGIVFLIVLGWKLVGIVTDNQDLKTAQIHMEAIEEIIKALEVSEGGEREYVLLNPGGWFLESWPSDSFRQRLGGVPSNYGENEMPVECGRNGWNRCLCLCEGGSKLPDILRDCNKLSVCIELIVEETNVEELRPDIGKNARLEYIQVGNDLKITLEENKLDIVANEF
tara:strand:+ start:810 stop:1391 length:582 start_codon:yes stop_codon:yes gene_type:complete